MRGQGLSWDHRGREVGVEITVSVSGGLLCHRPRVKSFHELLPLILMTPLCSRDLLFVSVFQMGKLRLREVRLHAQGPTAREWQSRDSPQGLSDSATWLRASATEQPHVAWDTCCSSQSPAPQPMPVEGVVRHS